MKSVIVLVTFKKRIHVQRNREQRVTQPNCYLFETVRLVWNSNFGVSSGAKELIAIKNFSFLQKKILFPLAIWIYKTK